MPWTPTATPGTKMQLTIASTMSLLEGCQSLSGPGGQKPLTEITALSDTAQKNKAGRPNYGKVSGECTFDPIDPSHLKVLAAFAAVPGVAVACEVSRTEHGAKAAVFSALFDEIGLSFPNEGPALLKFGASLTTALTNATATSVTPNAAFGPCVGQGTVLKLGSTAIPGVTNIDISGCTRALIPTTQLSATSPSYLVGTPNFGTMTFDMELDTSDATQMLVFAANVAPDQLDDFTIVLTDADASTITLTDAQVVGWEESYGKDSVNVVKVSVKLNNAIEVVTA